VIEDQRTGVLIPSGDPRALAAAVCDLMADVIRARQIGERASAAVRARFSFDRMVADFESLYLRELSRHRLIAATHPHLAAS